MKIKNILTVTIFAILFFGCKNVNNDFQKLDAWEKILEAVEEKNIDFLMKISSDSLQCVECNNGKSLVIKKLFFKEHFDQMKLVSRNEKYSYFLEKDIKLNSEFDEIIRISYKKKFEGNKYDIIYTIKKKGEKFKFIGVFSIP